MSTTLFALLTLTAPARAIDTPASDETRATELARLRREVETMGTDLNLRKEDLRNRLKATEAQRLEIEVQIRREELRLSQIENEAAARRAELQTHATVESTLAPSLRDAVAVLRAEVAAGLPFHTAERLKELDSITDQLDGGLITPEAGVARLWAFTEDEIRLARENGLDRQTVALPTGEILADVARLGMVALYFRSDGGVVGAAVRTGSGWTWKVLDQRDDVLAVGALFDKMQHGVRTGAFVLPDAGASS
jgi:hypothetical protein